MDDQLKIYVSMLVPREEFLNSRLAKKQEIIMRTLNSGGWRWRHPGDVLRAEAKLLDHVNEVNQKK